MNVWEANPRSQALTHKWPVPPHLLLHCRISEAELRTPKSSHCIPRVCSPSLPTNTLLFQARLRHSNHQELRLHTQDSEHSSTAITPATATPAGMNALCFPTVTSTRQARMSCAETSESWQKKEDELVLLASSLSHVSLCFIWNQGRVSPFSSMNRLLSFKDTT